MNPAAYLEMYETEAVHWWFRGRRAILSRIIGKLGLPKEASILEVGCGTGGNLEMLSQFGRVSAQEMDKNARELAGRRQARCDIRAGHCPDDIGFGEERFDLICMFDVLEHIEEDEDTLRALRPLLAEGGRIMITVPAYQWMWGTHDEFLHHKRRYSPGRLRATLEVAGLRPVRFSHFNTFLFPLAAAIRLKERLLGDKTASGGKVLPPVVNDLFCGIFSSERYLLDHFNLPFGVSILCICEADA